MNDEPQAAAAAAHVGKGRDFNHDLRKLLNDVNDGHDADRKHAGEMLAALKAGSASAVGTY